MLTTAWVDGVKVTIDEYDKKASKEAFCEMGHKLCPKRGKKMVHHFAHYPNQKCDPWRLGTTYWHAQWQKIVADKANLEVCLDPNGKILGHSAFSGASAYSNIVAAKLDGHIADIIRPSNNPNSRPLIVEIQHSSMSKTTIEEREAYYQHMVWLFDFTPRMTTIDKCNKIEFTDGKICYLKHKVTYMAMLSCANYHAPITLPNQSASNSVKSDYTTVQSPHSGLLIPATSFDQVETRQTLFGLPINSPPTSGGNNNNLPPPTSSSFNISSIVNNASLAKPCRGDECFNDILTPAAGFFMIINTRTRHWFDTTKPTYFDTGFCILRFLLPLNGSFVLTLYMSYEEFILERMPPVNNEKVAKADWFKTINPAILIKLGMIPKIIDVQGITICRNRIIINHKTCELADVGLSQGMNNQWHAGSFYASQAASATTLMPTSTIPRTVNLESLPGGSSNDDMLLRMMTQATAGVSVKFNNLGTSGNIAGEILIVAKLRRFLGLSSSTEVAIVNKKGGEHILVYCNRETMNMKDKFKTLEMKYRKGANDAFTGTKKMSGRQAIKQTRGAIQSSLASATSGGMVKVDKLKKDHGDAFQKEERANWYAKVSHIESKLANL